MSSKINSFYTQVRLGKRSLNYHGSIDLLFRGIMEEILVYQAAKPWIQQIKLNKYIYNSWT